MTGAYIRVIPTSDTVAMIRRITRGAALPLYPNSELHCTVMYCPTPNPNSDFLLEKAEHLCENGPFIAYADRVDIWESQGGSKIVVLRLRSSDLQARHDMWKQQGLRSTFPTYNPHVTLSDNIKDPIQLKNLRRTVDSMNAALQTLLGVMPLTFRQERMSETKPEKVRKSAQAKRPDQVVTAAKKKSGKKAGAKSFGESGKKTSKMPALPPVGVGPLSAPPVHEPELDDAEQVSLKLNGFNVDSHKRLLDGLNKL